MKRTKRIAIIALSILLLLCISTNAQCQETAKPLFAGDYGRPVIDYEKIILATLFIIALIVVAQMVLKKTRFNSVTNQGLVEVVYSYSISSKDKLLIVKAGQEYLLLGISNSGIRKIHILDKEEIHSSISQKNIKANEFANIFVNLLGKNRHA